MGTQTGRRKSIPATQTGAAPARASQGVRCAALMERLMRTVASWKTSAAESTGTSGLSAWAPVNPPALELTWECSPASVYQEPAIMATATMTSSDVVKPLEGGASMTTL